MLHKLSLQKVFKGHDIEISLDLAKGNIGGGEGLVFVNNDNVIIKIINPPAEGNIMRMYNSIDIFNSISPDASIKKRIMFSFMPCAYASSILNGQRKSILAYRFVKGRQGVSHDFVEVCMNENLAKRIDVSIQLLELIKFLHEMKVIHGDIFEDNFILSNENELYPIDSTGCGVIDSWPVRNRAGKHDSWGMPAPSYFPFGSIPTQSIDRWFAVRLVWKILINEEHPYTFIRKPEEHIDSYFELVKNRKLTKSMFPPPSDLYHLKDNVELELYEKIRNKGFVIFGEGCFTPGGVIFKYFISGYSNPQAIPSLDDLIRLLRNRQS